MTDASEKALGYILYDDSGIVELSGRMCTSTESRYHIYELELLAICEALDAFRLYIARCSELHIRTDSKIAIDAIKHNGKNPSERMLRFASKVLKCPQFKISYIKTKENAKFVNK